MRKYTARVVKKLDYNFINISAKHIIYAFKNIYNLTENLNRNDNRLLHED